MRVRDIDFERNEIDVRRGKGQKDRVTMLPIDLHGPLHEQLRYAKKRHDRDLSQGYGSVYMPFALAKKYRGAEKDWKWQYVFPSNTLSVDPRSGIKRRHHIHLNSVNHAVWHLSAAVSRQYHKTSQIADILRVSVEPESS